MATVKQVITFDGDEAEELRTALNGRALSGLIDELRTFINRSVQPEGKGDTAKRTRLVSGIKAGSEVNDDNLAAIEHALAERKEIVRRIADILGDDGKRTRELLAAHERAEEVCAKVSEQKTGQSPN